MSNEVVDQASNEQIEVMGVAASGASYRRARVEGRQIVRSVRNKSKK